MKYLKGLPNVAQYVGLANKTTNSTVLDFPAIIMAAAEPMLKYNRNAGQYDKSKFTSWDFIKKTIIGILNGYHVLHSSGIVHRDTKPENMLLTKDGTVLITDFGQSKYISKTTPLPMNNYVGSSWWSSPEILLKSLLKTSSHTYEGWLAVDAWAVGASLIDILTNGSTNPYFSYTDDDYDQELDLFMFEYNMTRAQPISRARARELFNPKRIAIKKRLGRMGLPAESDGEMYSLYLEAIKPDQCLETYRPNPVQRAFSMTPTQFIIRNRNPSVDTSSDEFVRICAVIEGFLTYNPETRMTVSQALTILTRAELPQVRQIPMLPTPTQHPETFSKMGFMLKSVMSLLTISPFKELEDARYVVVDRTYQYILAEVGTPTPALKDKMTIMLSAFYIAIALFEQVRMVKSGDIKEICRVSVDVVKKRLKQEEPECVQEEINNRIYMMLKKLPLLGKTHLDLMCETVLAKAPAADSRIIQHLGFLNMVCIRKMFYQRYEARIDELKSRLIELASIMITEDSAASTWTADRVMEASVIQFEHRIKSAMGEQNAGTRRNKKRSKRSSSSSHKRRSHKRSNYRKA